MKEKNKVGAIAGELQSRADAFRAILTWCARGAVKSFAAATGGIFGMIGADRDRWFTFPLSIT